MAKNSIVYSTDPDYRSRCPVCDEFEDDCNCQKNSQNVKSGTIINIRREVKGRRGKTVTTIANLRQEPKKWQKELQKLCGAGGTLKYGVIEIQGDHREKIKTYLIQQGFQVKFTGG
jgi:translation initiation factor 1